MDVEMQEFRIVNGARIESSYLEGQVQEAQSFEWKFDHGAGEEEHVHCMICSIAIARGLPRYQASGSHLCPSCYR